MTATAAAATATDSVAAAPATAAANSEAATAAAGSAAPAAPTAATVAATATAAGRSPSRRRAPAPAKVVAPTISSSKTPSSKAMTWGSPQTQAVRSSVAHASQGGGAGGGLGGVLGGGELGGGLDGGGGSAADSTAAAATAVGPTAAAATAAATTALGRATATAPARETAAAATAAATRRATATARARTRAGPSSRHERRAEPEEEIAAGIARRRRTRPHAEGDDKRVATAEEEREGLILLLGAQLRRVCRSARVRRRRRCLYPQPRVRYLRLEALDKRRREAELRDADDLVVGSRAARDVKDGKVVLQSVIAAVVLRERDVEARTRLRCHRDSPHATLHGGPAAEIGQQRVGGGHFRRRRREAVARGVRGRVRPDCADAEVERQSPYVPALVDEHRVLGDLAVEVVHAERRPSVPPGFATPVPALGSRVLATAATAPGVR